MMMDEGARLVLGAGTIDRVVCRCEEKLRCFSENEDGYAYLIHRPATPPNVLVPEDLAVTLAFNSNATGRAFRSLMERASEVDLEALPDRALEDTSDSERDHVARMLTEIASWPGFKASLATKTLHKKRPHLIPVLDNRAIFGAYLKPKWPGVPSSGNSVADVCCIRLALDSIATDLNRPENLAAWRILQGVMPQRSRIEIFDMVWWMYFREYEPQAKPANQGARSRRK